MFVANDVSYVPLVAVPQDLLGVDGASEELEHKFPVAYTEQDVVGGVKDDEYLMLLEAIF